MAKILEMAFRNQIGKEVTLSISNPKDTLTKSDVDKVMQDIIAKNIFTTTGGNLEQAVSAKIRVTDITELT